MWWVMMREPAAVQRLDSEPAERACKSEKKVPINSLTVLPYSQTRHQHAIAQVRKEDSNTLITCRTRSQKVKDKRAALTSAHIPVENFTWSQVWSSQAAAAQASTQRGMLT